MCLRVCVCEREVGYACVSVCVLGWLCACMCVCVCERERWAVCMRVCVCV